MIDTVEIKNYSNVFLYKSFIQIKLIEPTALSEVQLNPSSSSPFLSTSSPIHNIPSSDPSSSSESENNEDLSESKYENSALVTNLFKLTIFIETDFQVGLSALV
jgi:hypothetical protein